MNVHRRIQMVFGEQYGLSVESKENEGTRMILSMPVERGKGCFKNKTIIGRNMQ